MTMYNEFNSDRYAAEDIVKLKNFFDIDVMIETGTFYGATTRYLSTIAKEVHSIEIVANTYDHAKNAMEKEGKFNNVKLHLGNSSNVLDNILKTIDKTKPILFYLDAHWYDYWPILDELKMIGKYCHNNAIIVIDDFQVPNNDLGYDSYGSQPLNYDYIRSTLKVVYDTYGYYYNSDKKADGNRRGRIYIYPYKENSLETFPDSSMINNKHIN